jgi:hypothetical protein
VGVDKSALQNPDSVEVLFVEFVTIIACGRAVSILGLPWRFLSDNHHVQIRPSEHANLAYLVQSGEVSRGQALRLALESIWTATALSKSPGLRYINYCFSNISLVPSVGFNDTQIKSSKLILANNVSTASPTKASLTTAKYKSAHQMLSSFLLNS